MVKKVLMQTYLWVLLLLLYAPICDYCDLFLYRCKGVGKLDRLLD